MCWMCPSFLLARESGGLFPQALHVAHRADAEEAVILSIEVGGVPVAHGIGGTDLVEVFALRQTPGLLEPQPLLVLQGAHRGDGLEVVMQPRHAHVQFSCELLDGNWLVEVLAESLDGSGDGGSIAPLKSKVTEPATLVSHQKAVD